MNELVSVIIPLYNKEKYIKRMYRFTSETNV